MQMGVGDVKFYLDSYLKDLREEKAAKDNPKGMTF